MKQPYQHLSLTFDEQQYLWINLNSAKPQGNTVSSALLDELMSVCAQATQYAGLKLIILSSKHPDSFLGSHDLEQLYGLRHRQAVQRYIQQAQELTKLWRQLPVPIVAFIKGHCAGIGLEIVLACDTTLALEHSIVSFQHQDFELGITPSIGQFKNLIRRSGAKAAWTLLLSGQTWSLPVAQSHGLIDHMIAADKLMPTLDKIAHTPKATLQAKQKHHQHWSNISKWTQSLGLKQLIASYYPPAFYPAPKHLLSNWLSFPRHKNSLQQEAQTFTDLVLEAPGTHLIYLKTAKQRWLATLPPALDTPPKITIIGAGATGQAYALAFLLKGCSVSIRDTNAEQRELAQLALQQQLSSQLQAKDYQQALERLSWIKSLHEIEADFVIECLPDQLRIKQDLLAELEESTPETTLLLTTSLVCSLKDITAPLLQPQRVVGLHSFNPFPIQPLVEIIYLPQLTKSTVIERTVGLMRLIDKLPLVLSYQQQFTVYRILIIYLFQGMRLQQQGVPVTTIDQAARAFGMRYGPLELADHIGLDTCLQLGELAKQQMDLEIPALLRTLVANMKLGRKTQNGFYRYRNGRALKTEREQWTGNSEQMKRRLVKQMVEEARICLELGLIEEASFLDLSVVMGCGFPAFRGGPIRYATHPLSSSL
ncbi:3-hydroxyacyl-CoA dehydrogenase NAD-binding domain-containing protein [Thiofilum flexile]|uniref:3-hydroxyacyl-CoA dehydrogenase NAD-binding domain-containing protein n=1 Tax=Thiofilum flexile TaxID=125627 RepID=UPI00037966FA|nr:3-hydroxyacyl-CoA dehydrogenase NAD-binding domain-containing protein [Thiofilum flexile]